MFRIYNYHSHTYRLTSPNSGNRPMFNRFRSLYIYDNVRMYYTGTDIAVSCIIYIYTRKYMRVICYIDILYENILMNIILN